MDKGFSGSCLCGAVHFVSTVAPLMVGHCCCVDCRKSSGTGHCTHVVIPQSAFSVNGEVAFYDRAADSGNIVRRGFCPRCGAPLFSTNAGMPGMVFPRASALDDPDVAVPQMVVYASRALVWDYIDPSLPSFPAMPENMPV